MNQQNVFKTIGIAAASVLLSAAGAGIVLYKLNNAVKNVKRVDDHGILYSMDYTAAYENRLMKLPAAFIKTIGCSAFATRNEKGEVITARNYDLPHRDREGNATGLNVIFRLKPEGRYSSINLADAAWLTIAGIPYTAGALDEGKASRMFLAFMPYLCMDGMNEKGLTVSILSLDLKNGEKAVHQKEKGKKTVMITELVRLMLDHCANVQEAVSLAEKYNLTNTSGFDFHLFITDAEGKHVVMEWRYNRLYLTDQDAATNFYTAFDDAEDCYYGDKLKEAFVKADGLSREYHYGYGHGYERFRTLAETLDRHITDPEKHVTAMPEEEAMDTLEAVCQAYDGTDLTSHTQYSVLYNADALTAEVCVMRDYTKHYSFSLKD